MVGFSALGWYVTKSKSGGIIAAILYLISPFFLMYDRLALYDALLCVFAVWSLFLTILLVYTIHLLLCAVLSL